VIGSSKTVVALFYITASTIRNTNPFGRFQIEFVVIFHIDVHAQQDGGACQCLVIQTGSRRAAGTKDKDQSCQYED